AVSTCRPVRGPAGCALRALPPDPAPAQARDDAPGSATIAATIPARAPACATVPGRGPWAPCPAPISAGRRALIPINRAGGEWRTIRPRRAAPDPAVLR